METTSVGTIAWRLPRQVDVPRKPPLPVASIWVTIAATDCTCRSQEGLRNAVATTLPSDPRIKYTRGSGT